VDYALITNNIQGENEMMKIDIDKELSVFLNPEQKKWFFARLFQNRVTAIVKSQRRRHLNIILKNFTFVNSILQTTRMLKDAFVIDDSTMKDIDHLILDIFNLYLEEVAKNEKLVGKLPEYINDYAQFVEYMHLAILTVFVRHELLGREKRQKLLFLFKHENLRERAISKYKAQLMKKQGHAPAISANLIPNLIQTNAAFYRCHQGMYDSSMDDYVESMLITPRYAEHLTKGLTMAITITPRGKLLVKEIAATDEIFQNMLEIARQLAIFDDMGGEELAQFIKTEVWPEWDKIDMGDYYDEQIP
jgi:hypothetical protein